MTSTKGDEVQGGGASGKPDRATAASAVEPVPVSSEAGIPSADYAGNDFARGAQACREMMARFVEQGGDAVTAGSIRANWHPGWGTDPGAPPDVIDTWEAPECPEGERLYADYCSSVAHDEDHKPDLSPQGLEATARMLERWAIPMLPANRLGQVPFLRGLIECAIRDLRHIAIRDGGWLGPRLAEKAAQAIEARRAETGTGSVHESAVGSADAARKPPTMTSRIDLEALDCGDWVECWQCAGEGEIADCWEEFACVDPEGGCADCLKRCDLCMGKGGWEPGQ